MPNIVRHIPDNGLMESERRGLAYRRSGNYPETGFDEITGHLLEPDFGTAFYNQEELALRFLPTHHFQLASVQ
jgi:hypothetical protein